jgi:hypothetical protein
VCQNTVMKNALICGEYKMQIKGHSNTADEGEEV